MLDINLEFVRGMLFVRLDGILNKNTCLKLNNCLDKMINEKGLRYFVVNLEKLESIDKEGLKTIIDRYLDVAFHDGKLIICGYNNQFNENIELKSIFDRIERIPNELKALNLINI